MERPWYLCAQCHEGQFPADEALDVKSTDFSPGVRRMQATVGQEAPFDHGRGQMEVLTAWARKWPPTMRKNDKRLHFIFGCSCRPQKS
jgi:hypothetical protein